MTDESVPTAVYRCYDKDGRLLYVGITDTPKTRWKWHQRYSPWWPTTARKTLDWRDDRTTAETEERRAIRAEDPIHNVAGKVTVSAPSRQSGRGTDRQTFRLPADDWDAFAKACAAMGTDRSAYLRATVEWVLRKPGVKAPRRPAHDGPSASA